MLNKKNSLVLLIGGFLLLGGGCVSTGIKVEGVKWGMTEAQVIEVAGKPDETRMESNEITYRYFTQDKTCEVTFVRGNVLRMPICTSEADKKKTAEVEALRSNWLKWGEQQDIESWSVQKKQEYEKAQRLEQWMVAHPSPTPKPSMHAPIIEQKEPDPRSGSGSKPRL